MIFFLQLMVTGFVVGSVYALVALGFVLIYKSSRVINFAQGELVLVGVFVCLSLTASYKLPFFLAFLLTMVVAVLVGLLIERFFLRPMIGEPVLSIIMLTIGLSSFLRGIVEIIWGTETRVFPPVFPTKPINFEGIVISQVYMWSFILAVLFLEIFTVFFKFTNEGIAMRAAADDEDAALSMGISIKKIYGLAWAIAALVAAVGGVVIGNINGVNIKQETFVATATILKDAKKLGLTTVFTGNFWGTGQKLAELAGSAANGYLGVMPFAIWSENNVKGIQLLKK